MKWFLCILMVFKITAGTCNLVQLRDLFSKANVDEAANLKLIELTENITLKSDPIRFAYHAGGVMSMANHVYWPGSKLSYFNEGKTLLEKAVNYALTNVEIRFIRFAVQAGTPDLLGYKSNMTEDKAYILKNINKTDWSEAYKKEVKDYLNKT